MTQHELFEKNNMTWANDKKMMIESIAIIVLVSFPRSYCALRWVDSPL